MRDLLLITPPFTQLNTPYPATAYLKGFLNTKDISAYQMDLGIEVILQLFTKNKLSEVFDLALDNETVNSENALRIYVLHRQYLKTIEPVISFLQGKNQTFA
ncbi:MAG: radical SAM protein, partial [Cyclobacteriaceae bacterium]